MPAANVKTFEENFSMRVNGQVGVYNSILIPARKGPISTPILISSEKELLEFFTPNNTVEVGFNMAYYSALAVLQKTNKLWVTRIANGAEMGGLLINDSESVDGSTQINQVSPEKPQITFDVSGITDGSDKITVSNLQGGVENDLNTRIINIQGVVGSFTVTAVSGSELTLGSDITSSVSFTGSGSGTIPASVDYLGFDVDFGAGESTDIDISNLTSGLPADLLNASLTLIADGVPFTRTVVSTSGSTLTLDSETPSVTAAAGTGYRGFPSVSVDISGIVDGGSTIQLANINPTHLATTDLSGKTLTVVANMNDSTTLTVSSNLINPNGSSIDFEETFNNPSLIDVSTGEAPFTEAVATGFTDASAVIQTTSLFSITAADGGEWGKDIRIEIISGPEVREENAFMIRVFNKRNVNKALEIFTVSRKEGQKDGFGRNIFIDTVLESSKFIRGFNNPLIEETKLPKETVTRDIDGKIIGRSFLKFVAGTDGDAVTDSNMIAGMDLLNNKNSYPVSIFLDGGWATPAYQNKITEICEIRDDSVAILSVPYSKETAITYATDIVNYRNIELNINSTYAALYSCHVNITDKYNDRNIFVSPDGYAAAAINESKANFEIWYPPAGFTRGRLFVNDTLIKFTDGDLDLLSDNGINPIRFAPGKGIAIWGQYTLGFMPSSLDRLNVRLLLNEMKPAITEYLEGYLFDLNSKSVRDLVKVKIESYLSNIQARNGIYGSRVICDDTNNSSYDIDNHTLNVDVFIKPTQSIEYINFTTILSSTGIEFENIG